MESGLYGAIGNMDVVIPPESRIQQVSDAYFEMAATVRATEAHQGVFFRAGRQLCEEQGAECVALIGTDMFLAFEGHDPGFRTIDSAIVHVEALSRLARKREI